MTQTGKRQRRKFGRIRQFNSGRWQASYTGPDGRVYIAPKTFNAKIDAEAWLTDRCCRCISTMSSAGLRRG